MLIHRFEAELIFANADLFQDDVLARVHAADPRPGTVILDFEAVGHVDVTGAEALRSVHDILDALGTRLIVARAKSSVRGALRSPRDRGRPRRGQLRADRRARPRGRRAGRALTGLAGCYWRAIATRSSSSGASR